MPTIVDIEFRRRRPERFVVVFDNGEEMLFSPEIALIYQFAPGKCFEPSEFEQILAEDSIRRAKDQILSYLSRRAHSRHELYVKTLRKGYTPAAINQALNDLAQVNLINDAEFTRMFTHDEIHLRPGSKRFLREKLLQRGVDTEVFEPILEEMFTTEVEQANLDKVVKKFYRVSRNKEESKLREMLIRHLQSKGFGWDLIRLVVSG